MLQLQTVAKALENKLNAAIPSSVLPSFHPNVNYSFVVFADVGEYRKAIKRLNTINKYINCILRVNGDEKSGLTDETISAVWSAQFECLVPSPMETVNIEVEDELITYRFVDAVKELINSTLAASTQDYITGEDGILYYLGANYSNTIAGEVDTRAATGESIPLSVFIDYTVAAAGVSSANIILEFKDPLATGEVYERVYPTRLDIVRQAVQEGNLASDEGGVSKVTTQGSILTLQLTKPLRNDRFDLFLKMYTLAPLELVAGGFDILTFRLSIPSSMDGDVPQYLTRTYQMSFSEATIGAETNLAAACTATLVEALTLD